MNLRQFGWRRSVRGAFLVAGLALGVSARGEIVFQDDFEEFPEGGRLTPTNYVPRAGPPLAQAIIRVEQGFASVQAVRLAGSVRAAADCRETPAAAFYQANLATWLTNPAVDITWSVWIGSTNSGTGGLAVNLPVTGSDLPTSNFVRAPLLYFSDDGRLLLAGTTGSNMAPGPGLLDQERRQSPVIGQATAGLPTVLGHWEHWAGTVMTTRLSLRFCHRTLELEINGQYMGSGLIPDRFLGTIDAVVFSFLENDPAAGGNLFVLDDLEVNVLRPPRLTAIEIVGNDVRISLTTETGHLYSVLKCAQLTESFSPYAFVDRIYGTGGVVQIIDRGGAAAPRQFYRALIPP